MFTRHDDLPHPVPPIAYLRYKENWFFVIIAPDSKVLGMAHFSYEPLFERGRMSCNLLIDGTQYQYANQIPFPKNFAYSEEIGDGKLRMRFVEPHERFELSLDSNDLNLELTFRKKAPTFNYEAAESANPDMPSPKEIMGLGANQIFEHHQQGMYIKGSVKLKKGGAAIPIDGVGYRDHSRTVRCDNLTAHHHWCGFHFPERVLGLMSVNTLLRPTLTYNGGYVHDTQGTRALRGFEISRSGQGPDEGLPARVNFALADVQGNPYTIEADIAGRFGYVPLSVEAPGAEGRVYKIYENFCPITLKETGEKGVALVEIGFSTEG